MRKAWGKTVEAVIVSCVQCKIFYTQLVRCRIVPCINRVAFTNVLPGLIRCLYTVIFVIFNLWRGGFYTKFIYTNNNNYLIKYFYC